MKTTNYIWIMIFYNRITRETRVNSYSIKAKYHGHFDNFFDNYRRKELFIIRMLSSLFNNVYDIKTSFRDRYEIKGKK